MTFSESESWQIWSTIHDKRTVGVYLLTHIEDGWWVGMLLEHCNVSVDYLVGQYFKIVSLAEINGRYNRTIIWQRII